MPSPLYAQEEREHGGHGKLHRIAARNEAGKQPHRHAARDGAPVQMP
jgi:hypothetical protein